MAVVRMRRGPGLSDRVRPARADRYRRLRTVLPLETSRIDDRAWCGHALHFAAKVLILLSLLELLTGFIPGVDTSLRPVVLIGANVAVGGVILLYRDPQNPRRSCMVLTVYLLVAFAIAGAANAVPTGTTTLSIVLLFVWGGSWQRAWTPAWLAPLAAIACSTPWLFADPVPRGNGAGFLVVVPAAVLVGEALARQGTRLIMIEEDQHRMVGALADAAVTDDLTGVGNHRRARQLLEDLQPGDGLAVIDLDRFKTVNDRFGHAVGDRLLQRIGEFLLTSTRGQGNVARVGGEEFIVVLPGAGAASSRAVSRILTDWRKQGPLATISAGVCVHVAGRAGSETFVIADAALYRAKDMGRDRLEIAAG